MAPKKPGIQPSRTGGPGPTVPKVIWGRDQLIRKTKKVVEGIKRFYNLHVKFLDITDSITTGHGPIRILNTGGIFDVYHTDGDRVSIRFEGGMRQIGEGLWMPRDENNHVVFGDRTSYEDFLRATRAGPEDFDLEQKVGSVWVLLENQTGSQSKVNTHAANTSTHGVSEVADAADLNLHKGDTSTHGADEVDDVAERNAAIATHAADTSTHGVATVADAAALDDHTEDVSTHGVTEIDGVTERNSAISTHATDTSTHGVTKVADDSGIGARVYRDSNQSIPNATWTAIASFNQEQYDTDTIHDLATNPSRLTCKTAGKYIISGHVTFDEDDPAVGLRAVAIRVNGSTYIAKDDSYGDNEINPTKSLSTLYNLAVNDYVELMVYQSAGHALNVNYYSAYSPYFAMQRISG